MGCGSSKGKSDEGSGGDGGEVEFKDIGVWSLDDFFSQAKRLQESFKDLTGPLQEQKDKFFDATGFWEVPGAEVKHAFLGMFVSFSSLCNGEMDSLKAQWKGGPPFVDIDTDAIGDSGRQIYEGFVQYINALQKCVTEQLPQVLEDIERLSNDAERARDRAKDQLDALDFVKKAKALVAIAINIKQLAKLPAFIKATIENLKADLKEVEEAKNEVQTNWPTFKQHGTQCAGANVRDPVGCYKRIYGPIKYTMAQRTEWEGKMRDIVWRKFTKHFDPMQYPLTDLVEDGAKK